MQKRKPLKLAKWLAQSKRSRKSVDYVDRAEPTEGRPLSLRLHENVAILRESLGQSSDITFRSIHLLDGREACLLFVQGLSDPKKIETELVEPLTDQSKAPNPPRHLTRSELAGSLKTANQVQELSAVHEVVNKVIVDLAIVLLIDSEDMAFSFDASGRQDRAIEEPGTESVIRGPREGFNENANTSLTLIRRRLRSPQLIVEKRTIGEYTKTTVALCYVKNIIDPELVAEARQRLDRIDTDSIIDSGYIEEFIEDNPHSPFPQIQNTERPDIATSSLLEGRVVIVVDGSPFALIAPVNLWEAIQAAEDYYERYLISSLIRLLRYICFFIALYLPSLYVAITTFHQEMLPTKLLISIAAAREVVPFPAVLEAFFMEITFEALREASIRLPRAIGSAISIVGGLVIGQAAVQAGIVSAPMVIVVSVTGIASFAIPRYSFAVALRMLRFGILFISGTLGLFGVVICTLSIIIHLSGLRSFGVPYLQPVSPFHPMNFRDVFTRAPHWAMKSRPEETSERNLVRQTKAGHPQKRIPLRKRES